MKTRINEQAVIFVSILKWTLLATIVGAAVGFVTAWFLKTLNWGTDYVKQNNYYFLLLPLALFLSSLLTKYLAPDAEGHGTEKVIEAVHKYNGKIKIAVVPVKIIATLITLVFGGSAGKEGPCAQIGAGLASGFADILKFKGNDYKKIVICGISAGFASVFGTPIAGAIFGVEVLFVGGILYEVLLPSFISGIISYQVSSAFGIIYFRHAINFVPVFSQAIFLKIILAGVLFGLCSFLLIEIMRYSKKISDKLKIWDPLKGLFAGIFLVGLTFIFSKQYLGLGLNTIQSVLEGNKAFWYTPILKMIFTSVTLGFGGSGGIVTPIFFIGATSGAFFAVLMGLDVATFAGIGMVSLLAGAANTPIAASIMAIELFGPAVAPYAALACIISFLMTGHRSVYPSQVLSIKKSASFDANLGGEIRNSNAHAHLRKHTLINSVMTLPEIFKKKK